MSRASHMEKALRASSSSSVARGDGLKRAEVVAAEGRVPREEEGNDAGGGEGAPDIVNAGGEATGGGDVVIAVAEVAVNIDRGAVNGEVAPAAEGDVSREGGGKVREAVAVSVMGAEVGTSSEGVMPSGGTVVGEGTIGGRHGWERNEVWRGPFVGGRS